jgi:hypothetical protein
MASVLLTIIGAVITICGLTLHMVGGLWKRIEYSDKYARVVMILIAIGITLYCLGLMTGAYDPQVFNFWQSIRCWMNLPCA